MVLGNEEPMKLKKIISGGQTGADQGGLRAAQRLGIETGGFAPKNFRTEEGNCPWLETKFDLVETETTLYTQRTMANVALANATLIFGKITSPGTRSTIAICESLKKPYLVNPSEHQHLRDFLALNDVTILNVAGNRESVSPGIGKRVENFIFKALEII
jgi:hypothetical protein